MPLFSFFDNPKVQTVQTYPNPAHIYFSAQILDLSIGHRRTQNNRKRKVETVEEDAHVFNHNFMCAHIKLKKFDSL